MRAPHVGDHVRVHGRTVGMADRTGQVVEVRGRVGAQLLVVRFDDGRETILSPGPDYEFLPGDESVQPG